jgi:putative endonuclease
MPYMYILECRDGSYYTGSTIDLRKRLVEHQNGTGAKYTRSKLPVKLVYCEEYPQVDVAFRREKQVQKWSHEKKKALIIGSDVSLRNLSECRNYSHCKYATCEAVRGHRAKSR